MKAIRIAALLCFGLALPVTTAKAADEAASYPNRPIRLVVGFTAGGGNDIIARVVGQKLSESLGQPIVVENKPGAGAIVATEFVARSEADGYTLLIGASGAMVINPAVYAKLNYDTLRDFTPISELGSFPLILIVNASSPYKSVADLVAYAKANPGKSNYSSASAAFQLATELFKQKDRCTDADDPIQGRRRQRYGRDRRRRHRNDRGRRPGDGAGRWRTGPRARRRRAEADGGFARCADDEGSRCRRRGRAVERGLCTEGDATGDREEAAGRVRPDRQAAGRRRAPQTLSIDSVGNTSDEFSRIISSDLERWVAVARAGNIRLTQ